MEYGVATINRLPKIIGPFCRISSLLWGSFAKETNIFQEPTNRSHPITVTLKAFMEKACNICCNVFRCVATCHFLLQCVAVRCSALQCVAACCIMRSLSLSLSCICSSSCKLDDRVRDVLEDVSKGCQYLHDARP